jgi:hypothetical protein
VTSDPAAGGFVDARILEGRTHSCAGLRVEAELHNRLAVEAQCAEQHSVDAIRYPISDDETETDKMF